MYIYIPYFLEEFTRGLLISPFALCAVNSRARYIRGRGRIVCARSINFTVCVIRGLFEGAVGGRELFEEIRYFRSTVIP